MWNPLYLVLPSSSEDLSADGNCAVFGGSSDLTLTIGNVDGSHSTEYTKRPNTDAYGVFSV